MRKSVLAAATAAVIALGGGISGVAQAELIVNDPRNTAQSIEQVTQMLNQLRVMQQQYDQLMRTYQAISHLPQNSLNQWGQQLNIDQFRNALPSQSSSIGALMNGSGLGTGGIEAAARGYLNQNRVYAPAGDDFQARELQRSSSSVASSQAMASELYQSAANRVTALRGVETQLASAPDTKAVADLQARIATEQAYIQAQQVQAQSLAMWQASQQRNEEQRSREERRRQLDTLIEQAKARGG